VLPDDEECAMNESNELTRVNKIGLALAGVLGLSDVASIGMPTGDGQDGPPVAIVVLGAVLGVITLAALVPAFRKAGRGAIRLVAGTRIISAISALPAFFVDVDAGLKVFAAIIVVLTVAVVAMILNPGPARAVVAD
jgi:hypothetical protein